MLRCNSSDLESAVAYYIQAIKEDPKVPETYYRLASLMYENGQISLDSAIEQCKVAVTIDPENPNYGYPIPMTLTFGVNLSF